MSFNEVIEFSQIWTEYFTDLDKSKLKKCQLERAQREFQVWEKLPDNIKRIFNAIWEVEKYCHDLFDLPEEKSKLIDGKLGNTSNIRYLLDTSTQLTDKEKDIIAWNDNQQAFYGWEWWTRYFIDNGIIKLSQAHIMESWIKIPIAEVQRRFTYIHI